MPDRPTPAEVLAQRFHETYELLAPQFGYKTREASAVPWSDVPGPNRSLMVAVAQELIGRGCAAVPETWQPGRWWRVLGPDDEVWCETSDEAEARERMRPGDRMQRSWEWHAQQWRDDQ